GGSLILYALRAPATPPGGGFAFCSRETMLLANSVLLSVATAAVLLGTVYPLIVEALGGKLSVGAPYFNAVFVPLMVPLLVVLGGGVLARWKADEWSRLFRRLLPAVVLALLCGGGAALMLAEAPGMKTALAVLLAAWIVGGTGIALRDRLRVRAGGQRLPASFAGMCLAHAGLAVTVLGIAVSSNFSSELHLRMGRGDSAELAGYEYTLTALRPVKGPNYQATEAEFRVTRDGKTIATLHTQKRQYPVRGMVMTE